MSIVYSFPENYICSSGILNNLAKLSADYGFKDNVLLITSKSPFKKYEIRLREIFKQESIHLDIIVYDGRNNRQAIDDLTTKSSRIKPCLIIAFGGGGVLDSSRACAKRLRCPYFSVPTIAATDAPCLPVTVIYDQKNRFIDYEIVENPKLVVVDPLIILDADKRYLIAGMGDGIATYYEALSCQESQTLNVHKGQSLELGLVASRLCLDIILCEGENSLNAFKLGRVTKELLRILEANIFLSGLGVASCGVSMAHGLDVAITQSLKTKKSLHGERVAFGLLVQLIFQEKYDDLEKVMHFYRKVNLPLTLYDLGLDPSDEAELDLILNFALRKDNTLYNQTKSVTKKKLKEVILLAHQNGVEFVKS